MLRDLVSCFTVASTELLINARFVFGFLCFFVVLGISVLGRASASAFWLLPLLLLQAPPCRHRFISSRLGLACLSVSSSPSEVRSKQTKGKQYRRVRSERASVAGTAFFCGCFGHRLPFPGGHYWARGHLEGSSILPRHTHTHRHAHTGHRFDYLRCRLCSTKTTSKVWRPPPIRGPDY